MKVAKSCVQCRTGRRKCVVEQGTSCELCIRHNKQCSLSNSSSNIRKISAATTSPTTLTHGVTNDMLLKNLTEETRDHLVDLYFRFIHDKPHTLFHPDLFRKRVRDETIELPVLYSVMALAARFSEKDEIQRQTRPLFSAARTLLKSVIDCISLDNIHASILVGNLCGGEGETDAEALYYGIASRMAQIHEFPSFRDSDDSMTREMTIRTWWSLYMIDRWSSAGLNLPRQLQDKSDILPMHEARFWRLKKGEIVDARSTSQPSLWGHMIRLAQVFGPIQDFHEALANGAMEEYDIEPVTHELVQRFENFDQQLPPDQRFSPRTLKEHISAGLGSIFVALHLGYHHYSTLLYFPYLDNQLSQIPGRSTYVARCKSHAASFSDLLRTSYNTPHCEAVYLIVTHMTVVSSSVLLHTLLFGDDDELSDARERLYSNFEVLLKLKQYWPGADSMVDRLFTFQKVCMRSMDRTYAVDRWIIKFLLQHALPIDDEMYDTNPDLAERRKVANDALSMLHPAVLQQLK